MKRPDLTPLLVVIGLALAGPAQAQPAAFPTDSQFYALTCDGKPSFDPVGDGTAKGARDVVGDKTYPAMYVAGDGTYVYLRLRVEDDPITTTGGQPLTPFGWGFAIDTDGKLTAPEYRYVASGISETVGLVRVAGGAALATFQPTLNAAKPGPGGQTFQPVYVQVKATADGSTFGGDADYFITLAVPMAQVSAATAKDPSPMNWGVYHVWGATSSNGIALDADRACWNDKVPINLPGSVSGPIISPLVPTCTDKKKNGQETDVDCGGAACPGCANGKACGQASDCVSGVCDLAKKICVPAPTPDLGSPDAGPDAGGDMWPQPDAAPADLPAPDQLGPDLSPVLDAAPDLGPDGPAPPDAAIRSDSRPDAGRASLGGGGGCSVGDGGRSPVLGLLVLLFLFVRRVRSARPTAAPRAAKYCAGPRRPRAKAPMVPGVK